MGGSFGALFDRGGAEVSVIDRWSQHVQAINEEGLRLTGVAGEHTARVNAATAPEREGYADWVIVFVDSNATAAAAETVARVLKPDGAAITMQNGIGNVEALTARLGEERVIGGSSMCSASTLGPGRVMLTHSNTSTIGELDGTVGGRIERIAALFRSAGMEIHIETRIVGKIWSKFVVNCGVNALCAVTDLRTGEMTRIPELYRLQDNIITEALQVVVAKGVDLTDADIRDRVKRASFYSFNEPSMLQHVRAGKRTEIDALNGALVREGAKLGLALPYNEALVALLRGRERRRMDEVAGRTPDYDDWQQRVQAEPLPDVDPIR